MLNMHSSKMQSKKSGEEEDVLFHEGQTCKESACSAGEQGLIPRLGRSTREGKGNPLQYFCLQNSMDREAWQAIVNGVAKSQT